MDCKICGAKLNQINGIAYKCSGCNELFVSDGNSVNHATKESIYSDAAFYYNRISTEDIQHAFFLYEALGDYKDSASLKIACTQKIEASISNKKNEEIEQQKKLEEAEKAKEERKRKNKKLFIILAAALATLFVFILILVGVSAIKSGIYKKAVALYNTGSYEDAVSKFKFLGGYKDSKDYLLKASTYLDSEESQYQSAVSMYQSGRYSEAISLFENCLAYKDSEAQIQKITSELYAKADGLYNKGEYREAIEYLDIIPETSECYKDAQSLKSKTIEADQNKCISDAKALINSEQYDEARSIINDAIAYYGEIPALVDTLALIDGDSHQKDLLNEKAEFLASSKKYLDENNLPEAASLVGKLNKELLDDNEVSERASQISQNYYEFIKMNVDSVINASGLDAALEVVDSGLKVLPGDSNLLSLRGQLKKLEPKQFNLDDYSACSDTFYDIEGPQDGVDIKGNDLKNVYAALWELPSPQGTPGTCSLTYDLDGQYRKLSGNIYIGELWKDNDLGHVTVSFYGDGNLLGQVSASNRQGPVSLGVDLTGVQKLEIRMTSDCLIWYSDIDKRILRVNFYDMMIEGAYLP